MQQPTHIHPKTEWVLETENIRTLLHSISADVFVPQLDFVQAVTHKRIDVKHPCCYIDL